MRNENSSRKDFLPVQKSRIIIEKEHDTYNQTQKMLSQVDRITDMKDRFNMYKYIDSVHENQRNEAKEIRDAHFEAVRDPNRLVA